MASYPVFNLVVTSNINAFETIRRFPRNITISELQNKLELLTGASSATMELRLLDKNKKFLVQLDDKEMGLESYPIENDMYIHVHDPSHKPGEFEDLSAVPKFELSDESYSKREQSFRTFKQNMKQENLSEEEMNALKAEEEEKLKKEEELIQKFNVGDQCQAVLSGQAPKVGTIMYLGKTEFKPGFWVGVKYEQPVGKNDGSVGGKRYFECEPKHGGFVKPHDVRFGVMEETLEEI